MLHRSFSVVSSLFFVRFEERLLFIHLLSHLLSSGSTQRFAVSSMRRDAVLVKLSKLFGGVLLLEKVCWRYGGFACLFLCYAESFLQLLCVCLCV
jgi:hypothetical protein